VGQSEIVNEWKRQGAVEHLQWLLWHFLEDQFAELPPRVRKGIDAASDPELLERALLQLYHLSSLEDLML
jgi:hypothetical protein